MLLGNIITSHL